jgi:hypothetical protein
LIEAFGEGFRAFVSFMNFVNYLARLLDDFLGLSFFFGHEDIRVKIFLILLKSLLNDGDQFRTVLLRKTINR